MVKVFTNTTVVHDCGKINDLKKRYVLETDDIRRGDIVYSTGTEMPGRKLVGCCSFGNTPGCVKGWPV